MSKKLENEESIRLEMNRYNAELNTGSRELAAKLFSEMATKERERRLVVVVRARLLEGWFPDGVNLLITGMGHASDFASLADIARQLHELADRIERGTLS